jgi:hypothetical protein
MELKTLLLLMILTACVDITKDNGTDKLTLQQIEEKINGAWRLKKIETADRTTQFDLNSDTLTCIAFSGLKGWQGMLVDNHDGSYGTRSGEPFCELKERNGRKFIEYTLIFNDNWEKEIKSLSDEELVLADSLMTWTYVRQDVEGFE